MRLTPPDRTHPPRRRAGAPALAALLLAALACAGTAQAESTCQEPGRNMQCSELGTIRMDNVREIRGSPIEVAVEVTLNSNFQEHGARWFLFSVRNLTGDGANPVTLKVTSFAAGGAPLTTNKVDERPSETALWVDAEDVPVGQPIRIDMSVGAAEAGAFQLEALVMPFDRGYSPITDSTGMEASLFSFTLLGVKSPSASVAAEALSDGYTVPSLQVPAALAVLGVAAALRRRVA